MAKKKSRQTYLKRQRELQRMEKAELKRQKRLGRKRGEGAIESSPYGDVENPDLESGDPLAEVPEAESGESAEPGAPGGGIDIAALRKSLGLSALKEPIEPGAPRESAESGESEPSPPEVERS